MENLSEQPAVDITKLFDQSAVDISHIDDVDPETDEMNDVSMVSNTVATRELPKCFHYVGSHPNFITRKCSDNEQLEVLGISKTVAPNTPKFYLQYVVRVSNCLHYCSLCNASKTTINNKASNVITHIQLMHYNEITMIFEDLPKDYVAAEERKWALLLM